MDKAKTCLALISVAIVAVPLCVALITHRDNLLALFMPPQASDIMTDLSNKSPNATFVECHYNTSSRTVALTINITNPFSFALTINSFSAEVECTEHHHYLGNVTSNGSQTIPKSSSALILVMMEWTLDAASHFQESHAGKSSIFVNLVNPRVDVQGIDVRLPGRESIPYPIPIQ